MSLLKAYCSQCYEATCDHFTVKHEKKTIITRILPAGETRHTVNLFTIKCNSHCCSEHDKAIKLESEEEILHKIYRCKCGKRLLVTFRSFTIEDLAEYFGQKLPRQHCKHCSGTGKYSINKFKRCEGTGGITCNKCNGHACFLTSEGNGDYGSQFGRCSCNNGFLQRCKVCQGQKSIKSGLAVYDCEHCL
jgi:hypothetical protein